MSLAYFNLYPTDFEADTSHLTLEEDGAYNRLLRLCWMTQGCSLPDDDAWIMRRMRVDEETFARVVKVVLAEFFIRRAGRVSNARLAKEFSTSSEAHKKRVSAGKMGGEAKSAKNNNKNPSNAKAMLYQPEPEPEPDKKERVSNETLVHFDAFWAVWPVKIAKADAVKAWAKLSQPDRLVATENAKAFFERWQRAYPTANPIHPARYLNGKRWLDEISLKSIEGGRNGQPATKSEERMGAFLKGAAIP